VFTLSTADRGYDYDNYFEKTFGSVESRFRRGGPRSSVDLLTAIPQAALGQP